MAGLFDPRIFQNETGGLAGPKLFQIDATGLIPGGRIVGGQFSRGRWRDVHARWVREDEEKQRRLKRKRDAEAATRLRTRNRAQERADALAVEALRQANEELLARLGVQTQLAEGHTASVHALNSAMQFAAQNLATARRLEREEEEEALELFDMDE